MNEMLRPIEQVRRTGITLKFAPSLVPLVLSGEKNLTWRIGDEKNLQEGDELDLLLKGEDENGILIVGSEPFGRARVVKVWEKAFKNFTDEEKSGHEAFVSDDVMIEAYRKYYGAHVNAETIVKIIRFELIF